MANLIVKPKVMLWKRTFTGVSHIVKFVHGSSPQVHVCIIIIIIYYNYYDNRSARLARR